MTDNQLNKLPKNWTLKTLGDVANYLNGRAFKPSEWNNKGLPIVRIQNLNKDKSEYNFTEESFDNRFFIQDGDLLFAWSASLGAYIWNGGDAWLNQHIFKVVPYDNIDKSYLFYSLTTFVNELYAKSHGSGMVHVTKKVFEDTPILIPPLSEQQKIVQKIESLFTDLETGTKALKTALHQLKIYRQAVLNHFLMNDSWKKVRLGDVGKVTGGLTQNSKREKHILQIPFLRVANVHANRLELSEIKMIGVAESELERVLLKKNDILIVEGNGSIDQVGRAALWDDSINPCLHQNHLIKVRFDSECIANFLMHWLSSPFGRNCIERQASSTSGLHTLSISKIANLVFPFPPLETQTQIVSEIEKRMAGADVLEASLKTQLIKAENLRQSILKRAFEGKLV